MGRRHTCWCLHQCGLRKWYPHILSLPTINGIRWGRIAKQLSLRAARGLASNTIVALLTCGVERDDDFVAHLEGLDLVAGFLDGANELVAANEAGFAL